MEEASDAFAIGEYAEQKTKEYFKHGFWDDSKLSDVQKSIMDTII
jgi:hypothetical protein